MSQVEAFRAVRYQTPGGRDLSTRISPPYDVLDDADKRAMLQTDPLNFTRIDLPHTPPSVAGPEAVYRAAGETFRNWLRDGTLVQDRQPAIYVYHQHYRHGAAEFTRKMFFARLRLEQFGGSVLPHEQTFGGPKEDRLCLMKATAATLSPIFGLFQDDGNAVARRLEGATAEPLMTATQSGVENRVWAVTDPAAIADVQKFLAPRPTYIADGHHRYGTALLYRDWLVSERGAIPADHAANFVLCVFCAMGDTGLLILPTHRVLPGVKGVSAALRKDARFEPLALKASAPDAVIAELAAHGAQAFAVYEPDAGFVAFRPRDSDVLRSIAPQRSAAWRRLALSCLHACVLDQIVAPGLCGGQAPTIQYVKSAEQAVVAAKNGGGTALLVQPTTMRELQDVCGAGDLMPQKSTFFYPKLASGLVIHRLDEN